MEILEETFYDQETDSYVTHYIVEDRMFPNREDAQLYLDSLE